MTSPNEKTPEALAAKIDTLRGDSRPSVQAIIREYDAEGAEDAAPEAEEPRAEQDEGELGGGQVFGSVEEAIAHQENFYRSLGWVPMTDEDMASMQQSSDLNELDGEQE